MLTADLMRLAIEQAQLGIAAGQSPFGAVIIHEGQVCAAAHNTVHLTVDPSAHAEVNAIRIAARHLQRIDLRGCVLYTTCEPCPMCLSASHWAKLEKVYYGATIADAAAAGFSELDISAQQMVELGGSPLQLERGPLRDECADLFRQWRAAGKCPPY